MKKKSKKKSDYIAKQKKIIIGLLIAGLLLVVISALFIILFPKLNNIYQEATQAKNDFSLAQNAIKNENFALAESSLADSEKHFNKANENISKIKWLEKIPLFGTQIKALDNLSLAGANITSSMQPIANLGNDIYGIVKVEGQETSFGAINKKKKEEILKKLSDSPEIIKESQLKLELAVKLIENIPDHGLIGPIKRGIEPVKENLPLLHQIVEKAIPAIEVLPSISGYPDEKTYLFLLQNNTELRPTGGFIGTYGILKVKSADITNFKTDNIYNLDNEAKKNNLNVSAPEPLAKYLNAKQWWMRDCNWSPDYPTTAKEAKYFYSAEGGEEKNINGVIAVTPLFIKDLIQLTGPIKIEDEEFTADNFIDKLQYMVEYGYLEEGISDAARKDVIGDMSSILMSRILDLPKDKWPEMWNLFVKNIDQKQILLNMNDEKLQQYIKDLNWDGSIKDVQYTGRDFVLIVDANLAAKKTDRVMEKNINYTVNKEGDDLIASLQIKYKNNGTFTNFTTRYRTYTRIYVPKGSELILSDGFYTNDRYLNGDPTAALVKQDDQFNKTIFEGFISVEPMSEQVVTLKYKLPAEISELIKNNEYKLYFEKQSGTMDYGLNFTFDIGRPIELAKSLDLPPKIDNNKVQFNTDLNIDRSININFK